MLKLEDWEGQLIQVSGGGLSNKIVLGNLYRPPKELSEKYRQFTNELSPILSRLETLNANVVISGDYNITSPILFGPIRPK